MVRAFIRRLSTGIFIFLLTTFGAVNIKKLLEVKHYDEFLIQWWPMNLPSMPNFNYFIESNWFWFALFFQEEWL